MMILSLEKPTELLEPPFLIQRVASNVLQINRCSHGAEKK